MQTGDLLVIECIELDTLIGVLKERGYETIGPTVRDGAIVYDHVQRATDFPAGWRDEQDAGRYRLHRTGSPELFSHALGPHSWRRYLLPPSLLRWRGRRENGGFVEEEKGGTPPPRYALVGVRPCELAALLVQDRILGSEGWADPDYRSRREGAFVLAVNCSSPSGTCFCASLDTGPRCGPGFDLALTEIAEPDRHVFLAEVGSERGASVAGELPHRGAEAEDLEAAERVSRAAAQHMGRRLETDGLGSLLQRHYESPHWDQVADRCLTCGSCTMVCPTCFCTSMADTGDVTVTCAERWRVWDSCFGVAFSYVHGGSVRTSAGARYRQWITHKLSTWNDQFGVGGCVGCGRCITWCPGGIDITAEASAVRRRDRGSRR